MRQRKRIRVRVGELGAFLSKKEESKKKMFGELITGIMKETQCTWAEAKKIYNKNRVERQIKREFNLI